MAAILKTCIDWGKTFEFSTSEEIFYKQKSYPDPKRCFTCRRCTRPLYGAAHQASNECFGCNERLVRGVVTDAERRCLSCGRPIGEGGNQYAVIRGAQDAQAARATGPESSYPND